MSGLEDVASTTGDDVWDYGCGGRREATHTARTYNKMLLEMLFKLRIRLEQSFGSVIPNSGRNLFGGYARCATFS